MITMLTRTSKHEYYPSFLFNQTYLAHTLNKIMSSATYLLSDKNETMYVLEEISYLIYYCLVHGHMIDFFQMLRLKKKI